MHLPLLHDLVAVFALSIAVQLICVRIGVPVIVGFLLTGVLGGPHGLGLVGDLHDIELLAEIGVVLLMFAIGAEFSLSSLLQIRRLVMVGGLVQLGLTWAAVYGGALYFGRSTGEAVLLGFMVSMSSTAVVLKLLQERAEMDSLHGRTAFAVLIFQDIVIVPVMLFIPLLGVAASSAPGSGVAWTLLKGFGIIVMVGIAAYWLVPRLLHLVARTRSKELFILCVTIICFAVAEISQAVGLSAALGALIAGLIVSESDYNHEALGHILPFQQVFTSLFFISVGMLLDVRAALEYPATILGLTFTVVVGKLILTAPAALALGFPLRSGVLTGVALAQIGEFSFVLARSGLNHGVITSTTYLVFLTATVLSLCLTPIMFALGPAIATLVLKAPWPQLLVHGWHAVPDPEDLHGHPPLTDHLLIIGFGVGGKLLANVAEVESIPYAAIEMNPATVKAERAKGRIVVYGDATQEAALVEQGVKDARVIVVGIPDYLDARKIVRLCHELNPKAHIIARTRFVSEVQALLDEGANEVVPAEFETAIEIFSRVLLKYLVPRNEIKRIIRDVRADSYTRIRTQGIPRLGIADLIAAAPDLELFGLRVPDNSPLSDKPLAELQLRQRHQVNLLAIQRDQEILSAPDAKTTLQSGDILFFLGSESKEQAIAEELRGNRA